MSEQRTRLTKSAAAVISIVTMAATLLLHDVALSENQFPQLPDIGDPAASALPLSKEQSLGKVFVRELRAKLPLVSDMEINEYLNSLGTQLVTHSHSSLNFHFLTAKSPSVNAFATLGGVITVNSGLWLLMENESQLAGVLAHEIAHVTQRHLARFLAESNRLSWSNALALLSVIVAATYNSDLGRLGLHTSISAPLEKKLSYLRNHEREADNVGMRIMATTGLDPESVPRVFQHLHNQSGSSQVPEFLRTHPLSLNRLSDSLNRLSQYRGSYRQDSTEFQYAKARLYALERPDSVLQEKFTDDNVYLYRKAVALTQLNRTSEAFNILAKIQTRDNHLPVHLALAQVKIRQGNYEEAHELLQQLHYLFPNRETVSYYYAMTLLKLKRLNEASKVLHPIIIRQQYQPPIDKLYAEIAAAQGKKWLSHEHLANYYETNGYLEAALDQLDKAIAASQGSSIFRARVKEKRRQIEQLQATAKNPLR